MQTLTVYCSARDQNVRVVLTDDPTHDGQAPLMDSELICLEIGEACTGGLCPLCAQPVAAMDARLVRSGLDGVPHRRARAYCDGCDRDTEVVLSVGGYATCADCGRTRRWAVGS